MAKKNGKSADNSEEVIEKPQIEDLLAEKDEMIAEDEAKAEEDAKRADEEAAIPEVEVDLNEEREKTKKETIEAVTKEVVEPLKQEIIDLKKTLTPDEKDDYDKFVDDYTAKNGEAPKWKQVAMFLEERAVNRLKEEQAAQEEAAKTAEETAKGEQEKIANENFKVWQGQLQEMEDKGMLPKMEKPETGDPGFDARVQLYGLMQGTWKTDAPSTNLWEIHAKYGDKITTTREVAGADAPVSFARDSGGDENPEDFKYSEVHEGGQNLENFIHKTLTKLGVK